MSRAVTTNMSGTGQSRELDRQQWTPADVFDIEEAAEELGWDHDELVYNDLKRLYTKGVVKLHPDKLPAPATEEAKNAFHRWQQAWELLRAEIDAGRQFISDQWDMRNGQYVFMRCEEFCSAPPPAPPPAPAQPGSKKEQKQPAEEPPCKRQKTADAAGGAAAGAQDTFWQEQSVPWHEKVDFETERVRKQVDRDQLRAQWENDEKVAAEQALDAAKQVLEEQTTLALLRASVEQLLADVHQQLRRYVVAELLRAELAQVRKDHYWRFWMDEILSERIAPSYVHDFAQRIAPKEDMFDVVWYVPYKIVIVISSDQDEAEDEAEDEDEDEDEQERRQGGSGVSASGPSAPRAPGGPSAQGGSAQHHRRSSRNPVPTDRYRPIEDPRRRDPV